MANKAAIVGVLGLATLGGIIFLATRAKAVPEVPPEKFTLTVADIMAAHTIGELEVNYTSMNTLYITCKIDRDTYEKLYQAYVTKFYQLVGGA